MPGTSIQGALTSTLDLRELDKSTGLALTANCTGAAPTTADIFSHGCLITRVDGAAATPSVYQNTGTSAIPVWTLMDTTLPGATASSLIDTNSATAVDVGTTASAVNNLRVTNSAAGAVSANAILLSAVGTDSAISIQVSPKGATGILTLGLATGTGDVVLGSSSGTQTVKISNGAGIANTNIAAVTVAGSTTNIATAAVSAATDTVNIGTGNAVTSGGKAINIATGIPGAGTTNVIAIGSGGTTTGTVGVTIGSVGNAAHTTLIQGGSGATAIALTPQTTGVVTMGATAGTGDVVVGSSSATQSVKIGNGAGVATVNIANVSVAGANVNVATAVTGAGITDTVAISTGNAAATGLKVVNILTGTPGTSGNNRLTMGGGATSAVTVNAALSHYSAPNFITGSAAANAPVGTLTNASGANVTVAAGLKVHLKLAAGLQAGANTFNLNGHGTDSIKKATNPATDLGTAFASGGIAVLMFDGTVWQCLSQ